jgi:hypothetical protein
MLSVWEIRGRAMYRSSAALRPYQCSQGRGFQSNNTLLEPSSVV